VQADYTWLVVVGILNSVVGIYYYLNVMKYVYLYRMEKEDEDQHPLAVTRPSAIALLVLAAGVILIGTVFAPWFGYASSAAANLF
jgi:NADH-quinone oxidoreductase subunit N